MKTDRLYYRDSLILSFDARVVRRDGNRVVLDRTAFYPTSGGQPHDTGVLSGARVIDVEDNDDGEVIHELDRPLNTDEVHGEIDRQRRLDHMQQHTGQHLLSAAFVELYDFHTVSFHLGDETCTIDLSIQKLTDEQVERVEARCNAIVSENRPVRVLFRDKEELADLGLRKETKREGEIRVIEIDGLDRSACGGTHTRSTGEIGAVLLRKIDKVKQGIRVEFVCGNRAIHMARRDFTALTRASGLYSAKPHELPEIVAKKIEESKVAERERKQLLESLAAFQAREMYEQATPDANGVRMIRKTYDNGDSNYVRAIASQIARQPKARAILSLRQPPTLIVSQTQGMEGAPDLGALIKQTGLRGGGNKDSAQAGAPDWDALQSALQLFDSV